MKSYFKITTFLISISFLISCTSTSTIQSNLNENKYSLEYLMDSEVSNTKKDIMVSVDTIFFNPGIMEAITIVEREKGWFIPLIVFNMWKSANNCSLGHSMFEEQIPSFLKESIIEEINRSGDFKVDSDITANYSLEITIDEISTKGPYISSGYFYTSIFSYGYSYSDVAGPALSNMRISYNLKKSDEIVLSNSFNSEKITEQIDRHYTNTKHLQHDYAVSMVEATSYNFKNIIELIVYDLNKYFIDM